MRDANWVVRCALSGALSLGAAAACAQGAPAQATNASAATASGANASGPNAARPNAAPASERDSTRVRADSDSAFAAVAPPAPPPTRPFAGLRFSGFGEASYSHATHPTRGAIVGRLYDRRSDEFMLNAVKAGVERAYVTDRLDGGVRVDVLVGQNASVLQSNGLDLGPQGDITQLYVTLNIPTANGHGVQIRAGKMATLLGLEVIEDPANPNWSEGNQFAYVENFTGTGLEVGYRFDRRLDAELRVYNGWDVVADDNRAPSFMGRVGVAPDSLTSVSLVGYAGAEEPGDDRALRYGTQLLAGRRLGRVQLWLQGDYGREQANAALPDPARAAVWWALGAWASADLTPTVGVALRADYLDDEQGARTTAAFALPAGGVEHRLASGTATLNLRAWRSVLVRPEVRFDHSSRTPFDGRSQQLTAALSFAFIY